MTNNHNNLKSSGTSYKCMDCGYIWHYDDDACPECGSVECCDWNKPVNRNKDANDIDVVKMAEKYYFEHKEEFFNFIKFPGKNPVQSHIELMADFAQFYHREKMKEALPSDRDIAVEIVSEFLHNPHPNQRDKYAREKTAFANGAKWVINKIISDLTKQER